MFERLTAAKDGSLTVLAGGKALHSRYDPAGEAERYLDTLENLEDARFFVLIEPCLGYVIPVLRKNYPTAKIVSLHVSDFFASNPGAGTYEASWSPGAEKNIQDFLEAEIPDTEAAAVRIIEWRPAMTVYGGAYLNLLKETIDFIKRIDANVRTIRGFGRRWFRNCLRNAGIIRRALLRLPASRQSVPWIVTGAGPSLEEAIPLIKKLREQKGGRVLAASSSAPALAAANVKPDMIISTDGGSWALFHLYESVRKWGKASPALAACIWAALPSQYGDVPIFPIGDGSLWQGIILETVLAVLSPETGRGFDQDSGRPAFGVFPQRGTVTASAVDLALSLTSGPVFLAGMDLAHRDIKSHAKPYAFDRLQEETAGRFAPRYSQTFARSERIAASGSNGIYAAWFKRQLADYPERLFSLGNNNPVFDPLGSLDAFSLRDEDFPERASPGTAVYSIEKAGTEAVRRAVQALTNALDHPQTTGILLGELGPLILPDREAPGPAALKAEIQTLGRRYGAIDG
ncbi:MAG: DUF115 domain-containing protein [Treponema sp.]|jgi:hypothetical protein|nr:DUF115 domain-containing protein [Treponema sp.]